VPYNTPEKRSAYMARTKEHRSKTFKDWMAKTVAGNPEYHREKYERNKPERIAQARKQYYRPKGGRDRYLSSVYNVTAEEFDKIFLSQNAACAICRSPEPQSRGLWYLDHCHKTGTVRGILCCSCNQFLGHLEKRPELLYFCIPFQNFVDDPPAVHSIGKRLVPQETLSNPNWKRQATSHK
jgi:hypothetical protein